jgi:hypothetical protein
MLVHTHPYQDAVANSESDRLMGLMHLVECRVSEAKIWLTRSLEHNPSNDASREALRDLRKWSREESMRIYQDAKDRYSTDLSDYYLALTCDPDNILAKMEVARIIEVRDRINSSGAQSKR